MLKCASTSKRLLSCWSKCWPKSNSLFLDEISRHEHEPASVKMNKTLADLSKQELRRNTATSEGDNSEAVSPDARRTKAGANVRDRQEIIFKKGKVIKLGGDGTNLFVGDEVAPILPLIDTDDEKSSDDESASFNFLSEGQ